MITTTEPKPRTVRGMTLRELLRNGPHNYPKEKLAELARRSGVATDCKMAIRLTERQLKDVPERPAVSSESDFVRDSTVEFAKSLVQFSEGTSVTFVDRDAIEWQDLGHVPVVHFESWEQDMDADLVDLILILTCERLAGGKSVRWTTVVQSVPGKTKRSKPIKITMLDRIGLVDVLTGESLAVVMLINPKP